MKNIVSTVLTVAVTFVVTAALSLIAQYLTFERGSVTIGSTLNILGTLYVPVDVFNYTSQAFDKLRLLIPSATTPTSLVASRPVQIELAKDAAGTHIQARILVSGLEAKQLTRLLIPINNESDARLVELLNGPDLNVKIVDSSNISNPVLLALRDAVVPAALVSLLLALAMAWFQYRVEEIRSKLDKAQAESTAKLDTIQAEAATKIQHLTAQLDTTSNSLSRIKVLLLARLADYAKELEFWRSTMAKFVLAAGGAKQDVEAINKQVTDSLKTFGTRGRGVDDFEAIRAFAGMLQRAEAVKSPEEKEV
jgi:hypothetical protein